MQLHFFYLGCWEELYIIIVGNLRCNDKLITITHVEKYILQIDKRALKVITKLSVFLFT